MMFVLPKGSERFQAWRPHNYSDRYEWTKQQFLDSIISNCEPAILQEGERITAKMFAGEQPTSNELMLHIVLEGLAVECLKDRIADPKAFHARLQHARMCVSIYDADEQIIHAAMRDFNLYCRLHSQEAYDAAERLRQRDPMNSILWDFIESVTLPTLLNMRGDASRW